MGHDPCGFRLQIPQKPEKKGKKQRKMRDEERDTEESRSLMCAKTKKGEEEFWVYLEGDNRERERERGLQLFGYICSEWSERSKNSLFD